MKLRTEITGRSVAACVESLTYWAQHDATLFAITVRTFHAVRSDVDQVLATELRAADQQLTALTGVGLQ